MRLRRSGVLAASALLIVIATAVSVRVAQSQRSTKAQSTKAHSSSTPPRPEIVLEQPRFEVEPSIDPKLVPPLRMPFPAGVVVLCCQGNRSEPGQTHALAQNLHALDFSNRVLTEVTVVAAADGTVAYVIDDARSDDENAGGGYGNQVRLLHQHGLFTVYAHLDRALVRVGQHLAAGQTLGTMGRTGLAGDRHLHFSLHQGAIDQEGVPNTLEIPALVSYEVNAQPEFAARASNAFRCSSAQDPWSGALYASENDGNQAVLGAPPPPLAQRIHDAAAPLARSVSRRSRLWNYAKQPVDALDPKKYQAFLEPLLAEDPRDPVTQYTWAVEVELAQRRLDAAKRHLDQAQRAALQAPLFEPWLNGWIEAQRGTLSLLRSQPAQAERHFAEAKRMLPIAEIEQYAEQQRELFARVDARR